MRNSRREANLRALLSDNGEVRESVAELAKTYEAFLAEDSRGTRLAHMVDTTQRLDFAFDETHLRESSLPDAEHILLSQFLNQKHRTTIYSIGCPPSRMVSPKAKFLDKFSLRGVQYSTASCRTRNSHVFFRPWQDSPESSVRPGQITHIFLHSQADGLRTEEDEGRCHHRFVYLCIQPYAPLHSELGDADKSYRRFGFAGGFLSGRDLGPPIIVDHSSIISHVAVTPREIRGHKVFHILPMDRVSFLSL